MSSRIQSPGDGGISFRPTKLRSSLRRKVSSIFGKRPNSCNFDQLSSHYNDTSLSASSQTLYSESPAASPSLDAFLESIFNNGSHSATNLNHTESLSSLLQASNVCFNPTADAVANQLVASKTKGEKAKDFKTYIKKVASKRKEKISSSISNLSNRIKESSLLKRQSSFVDYVSREPEGNNEGGLNGGAILRRNTHYGIESGHFQRSNFRWSCNIPSDVNFSPLLSPVDNISEGKDIGTSSFSHLEPFRHIDPSSEDDFSLVDSGTSDMLSNRFYNCSNRNIPEQPFARTRSANIQRNRRRVVSYQFDPSIDDFINDLNEHNQASAKEEVSECNLRQVNLQHGTFRQKDFNTHYSENSKPEDIYSNWDVYMDHKHSAKDSNTKSGPIYDEECQYANFESLEDEYEYLDLAQRAPNSHLLHEDDESSDPEIKMFYNGNFKAIPPNDLDPRKLALFEQTIPEEEDNVDEVHRNQVDFEVTSVENDSKIALLDTAKELMSTESLCQICDDAYFQKIKCNKILFTELEIGKRFLFAGRNEGTRSLLDISKLCHGSALSRKRNISLGNIMLNSQDIMYNHTNISDEPLKEVKSNVKKRRRRKKKKFHNPIQNSAEIGAQILNPSSTANEEDGNFYINNCRRGKRKNRKRRNRKRNRNLQKAVGTESYVCNVTKNYENSDCEMKYSSKYSSDQMTEDFKSTSNSIESPGVSWILTEGEECLSNLQIPASTLSGITKQVEDITELCKYAKDKVEQTLGLLQGELADSKRTEKCQEEMTKGLSHYLASFGYKLNLSKDNLEDTAKCYLLLDKAYGWALRAMKVVVALKATGVASPEQVSLAAKTVSSFLEENPPVPVDAFEAMIDIATKLENQTLLQQCKVAQSRCCETLSLLKNRHAALLKARRQIEFDCQSFVDLRELMGGVDELCPLSWLSNSTLNSSGRRKSVTSLSSRSRDPLSRCSSLDPEEEMVPSEPQQISTSNKQALESRTSLGNIKEMRESSEDLQGSSSMSLKSATHSQNSGVQHSSSGPAFSSGSSSCSSSESYAALSADRLLNKSPSWQYHKASSQVTQDCPPLLLEECLTTSSIFRNNTANSHLLFRGSQINLTNMEDLTDDEIKKNKTLLLIMQELKQTEKAYVNSLEYIIENYIPELLREDIPQALRGQRNVIFGNIEKIFEFHANYFFIELESCHKRPFSVGSVFLKFEKQFYLYALYNKNKPKSDSLMAEYGSSFFKSKQIELGDKMDLSSYLLKPVQRMGKYALLLKQLIKECSRREEDQEELIAAQEMVQFQLRHGNDLLAMDSLRDCDVNLKEQGRLLRQGELTVSEGNKKKSNRHVFLFEDLILFSKSRRDPEKKNLEIFQYKYSMKMTDIGMTEQFGENTTRFEIWFRKRKPGDTYILQATTVDLKESWTEVLSKVLWRQALKNRSLRLHEMSSMGIGNKPCLDIRPSEDQICERSVCINQRGSTRFKPTVPYMETAPSRRPHSIISVSSSGSTGTSSSNSSSTGPTFAGTLNLGFEPGDSPRPLARSVTRTSQCSAESGISTDIYSEKETCDQHYKVERSNSSATTTSGDSVLSPLTALVSQVCTSSTYVNASPHDTESCLLNKNRSTGSFLTTEV